MSDFSVFDYECQGQISMTDYLKSKIVSRQVMDLTAFINNQGKAQYTQIGEIISATYDRAKDSDDLLGIFTNAVSVYVLNQSMKYMEYLRKEAEV